MIGFLLWCILFCDVLASGDLCPDDFSVCLADPAAVPDSGFAVHGALHWSHQCRRCRYSYSGGFESLLVSTSAINFIAAGSFE